MRKSGILMHISSLPGKGGCGTMGAEARRFADFLHAAGQSCWQTLPLTPPARGDSPYSSLSVFAGNPYFIDLRDLANKGLLPSHLLRFVPEGGEKADFGWCEAAHMKLLRESFAFAGQKLRPSVERFKSRSAFWLPDYALFMALRAEYGDSFRDWPLPLRTRGKRALKEARSKYSEETAFWEYAQFIFYSQWRALKRYANARGIELIGDMPIYADRDGADVWGNSSVFELDGNLNPLVVAGVPPDAFTEDGQLWGNPLYDWKYLKRTKYKWWTERLRSAASLFDCVRIDHFRAVSGYYAIPAEASTARDGKWRKGPGMDFIRAIRRAAPGCGLIAEDLGYLDDGVRSLISHSGLPGMKVLLFAFGADGESDYLPHNFVKNCVGYIGTHDNDTVQGWIKSAPECEVNLAMNYLCAKNKTDAHWNFIRGLMATPAERVIIQTQDVLGLDEKARMNTPGTAEGNWGWRLIPGQLKPDTAKQLKECTGTYFRTNV